MVFGFDQWSWFLPVKVKQFGFNAHEFPRNTEPLPYIREEGGIENELQVIYGNIPDYEKISSEQSFENDTESDGSQNDDSIQT
jgi:hypothetical protein